MSDCEQARSNVNVKPARLGHFFWYWQPFGLLAHLLASGGGQYTTNTVLTKKNG